METAPRIPDNFLPTIHFDGGLGSGCFGALGETYGQQSDTETKVISSASPKAEHLENRLHLEAKAPPVQNPYSMENSMSDLPCAAYALELFLASHMLESEDYLDKGDPKK